MKYWRFDLITSNNTGQTFHWYSSYTIPEQHETSYSTNDSCRQIELRQKRKRSSRRNFLRDREYREKKKESVRSIEFPSSASSRFSIGPRREESPPSIGSQVERAHRVYENGPFCAEPRAAPCCAAPFGKRGGFDGVNSTLWSLEFCTCARSWAANTLPRNRVPLFIIAQCVSFLFPVFTLCPLFIFYSMPRFDIEIAHEFRI